MSDERLARLRAAHTDGTRARTADLDWVLYNSFPDCAVDPGAFAELLPVFEREFAADGRFDFELWFVRVLELSDRLDAGAPARIAAEAVERIRRGTLEPADAVAAVRFALRAMPADHGFLEKLLSGPAAEAFRFHWTLDFVLDEREPREYFALSYLRDEDPETHPVLSRFPVPAARAERLAAFFRPEACRERLTAGWDAWVPPAERAALEASVRERMPGFRSAQLR